MKTTGLTLAEALATGRPFKHACWDFYITKDSYGKMDICREAFWSNDWEVKEEEKPPMEVFVAKNHSHLAERCSLEELASALAPLIKKELKL